MTQTALTTPVIASERMLYNAIYTRRFLAPAELTLRLAPELFSRLTNDQNACHQLLHSAGLALFVVRYARDHMLRISETQWYSGPYAVCGSHAELLTFLKRMHGLSASGFFIRLTDELTYEGHEQEIEQTLIRGGLHVPVNYRILPRSGHLWFRDVTWSDTPLLDCASETAILRAFRAMADQGRTSFHLLVTPALFEHLYTGGMARLHQLKTEAFISDAHVTFSRGYSSFFFRDVHFVRNAQLLTNLRQAAAYIEHAALGLPEEITLFCTRDLYNQLIVPVPFQVPAPELRVRAMACGAGIQRHSIIHSPMTCIVTLNEITYYAGFRVACLAACRHFEALTAPEKRLYRTAMAMAKQAMTASQPLDIARFIHDQLIRVAVYDESKTTPMRHTAIGALLVGTCVCDGFADAFYLIGTLAGLAIRYQSGYNRNNSGNANPESIGHLWNLVFIDDNWLMVDVTWDVEDGPSHLNFALGMDRAWMVHWWDTSFSPLLPHFTDPDTRPDDEYTIRSNADLEAAISRIARCRAGTAEFVFARQPSELPMPVVKELLSRNGYVGSYTTSWDERAQTLRLIGLTWPER